jgi:4-hydroxythreonine-4-phosphate dehydrogenase
MSQLPHIAVSLGDPHGIGPEVVLRALSAMDHAERAGMTVFGPARAFAASADLLGVGSSALCELVATDATGYEKPAVGTATAGGGRCAMAALQAAAQHVLSGKADALVTGPVSKQAVNMAGVPFVGHTEFLRELCGAKRTVMMFVIDQLRVALVTTHLALKKVPLVVSVERVMATILMVDKCLRDMFRIARPSIAVCALNPHAGDGGLLGFEDEKVIAPAVRAARQEGLDCHGPFPADTLFVPERWKTYHAVIAVYHDQAMIPVKTVGFRKAVNVTLGLSFPRTSPCHGVAYDIVGKGVADPGSCLAAMRLARQLGPRKKELF